ncbi:transketolase family protein [Candidatus Uhrbacteria bacterium]|nr:transketolase family protein [Candidatus Uhrbacteria bacterium]
MTCKANFLPFVLAKHLHAKLFTNQVVQLPTRNGYGDGLVLAGRQNPDVVVLCCDLTESTRSLAFQKEFPNRFVEVGVAEQNMMGLAAGMAAYGKVPFASSYAVFSPGRNWDQVRVSVAYAEANVKIAGAHSGISVGPDGATHQALEDIAITRVLPNMVVLAPCDAHETRKATLAAAAHHGPVYLRFTREPSPVLTTPRSPFMIGKAQVFRTGTDATIVACGPLVYEALLAAECIAGNGAAQRILRDRYPALTARLTQSALPGHTRERAQTVTVWTPESIRDLLSDIGRRDIEVINSPSVKPLDADTIAKSAAKTGRVVTVEEHQITGGLFGAVAEALAPRCPVPILPIGMPDSFGESGEPRELLEKYGMTAPFIIQAIGRLLS